MRAEQAPRTDREARSHHAVARKADRLAWLTKAALPLAKAKAVCGSVRLTCCPPGGGLAHYLYVTPPGSASPPASDDNDDDDASEAAVAETEELAAKGQGA